MRQRALLTIALPAFAGFLLLMLGVHFLTAASEVPFRGGVSVDIYRGFPFPRQVRVIVGVMQPASGLASTSYQLEGLPTEEMNLTVHLPRDLADAWGSPESREAFVAEYDALSITVTDSSGAVVFRSGAWVHSGAPMQENFLWSRRSSLVRFRNDEKYTVHVDATRLKCPPCPDYLEIRLESPSVP